MHGWYSTVAVHGEPSHRCIYLLRSQDGYDVDPRHRLISYVGESSTAFECMKSHPTVKLVLKPAEVQVRTAQRLATPPSSTLQLPHPLSEPALPDCAVPAPVPSIVVPRTRRSRFARQSEQAGALPTPGVGYIVVSPSPLFEPDVVLALYCAVRGLRRSAHRRLVRLANMAIVPDGDR
eukprot:6143236-Prymnesium_polylepis.1